MTDVFPIDYSNLINLNLSVILTNIHQVFNTIKFIVHESRENMVNIHFKTKIRVNLSYSFIEYKKIHMNLQDVKVIVYIYKKSNSR